MYLTTRRHFFRNLIDNILENIQNSVPVSLISSNEPKKNLADKWVDLGYISDFTVGNNFPVNNGNQILISRSDGIFVVNEKTFQENKNEPRLLIQLGERGLIKMNYKKESPEGTVLSIMTGELVTEEDI